MSVELKPGYWKTRDGSRAHVLGKSEWDNSVHCWAGSVEGNGAAKWHPDGRWLVASEDGRDLVAYLGPTLPPDPGEGFRLLEKYPKPELTIEGDECRTPLDLDWRPATAWRYNHGNQEKAAWYRRRIAPTPPVPPEGYELCPDGTPWERDKGWKRFSSRRAEWHDIDLIEGAKSGSWGLGHFDWYARPIARWEPTKRVRALVPVTLIGSHKTVDVDCELTPTHREFRRGSETKWVPVEVQP